MVEQVQNPFALLNIRLERIEEALQTIAQKETLPQDRKLYYSIREAAEKLQVSEITMYRNVHAGKIPSKRVGSRRVIPADYIEKA